MACSTAHLGAVSLVGCLAFACGCLGCQRGAGAEGSEGGASAKPPPPPPRDAPTITTYLLEERRGVDTLSIYSVVQAPGHLKPGRLDRDAPVAEARFGVSLIGAAGDTLLRRLLASKLAEDLDVGTVSGELRSVHLEHATATHLLRADGPAAAAIAVETRDGSGAVLARQLLPVPAPD